MDQKIKVALYKLKYITRTMQRVEYSQNSRVTGKNPTDDYLEAMMTEAPGPINFTMFLTMFGEKLNGTDPEDVIRNAFACFDEEGTGNGLILSTSS